MFIAGISSPSPHILSTVMQSADKLTFSLAVEKAKMLHQVREDAISIQSPRSSHVHATEDWDDSVNRVHSSKIPPAWICLCSLWSQE